MANPTSQRRMLLPIGIVAVLLVFVIAAFTFNRDRNTREGGTAESGLPAAVSPDDGADAGVPAAGAGPIAQTPGEAAGAIGAGTDPQPEQPEGN